MCSEAKSTITSGSWNVGLLLLGASAGIASDETRPAQHGAESRATRPRKPSGVAKLDRILEEASMGAPAAAMSSESRSDLVPFSSSPNDVTADTIATISKPKISAVPNELRGIIRGHSFGKDSTLTFWFRKQRYSFDSSIRSTRI